MEENFNVENPTKENIDYAFKNLLFYVTSSTLLDLYKDQKEKFKNVLIEINSILEIYVNKENLTSINEEKKKIKYDYVKKILNEKIKDKNDYKKALEYLLNCSMFLYFSSLLCSLYLLPSKYSPASFHS